MLTKLAHDYSIMMKKADEEETDQKPIQYSLMDDAGYGASIGGKAGALYGGITGAASGGPIGAFPGALFGSLGGYIGGGLYGAAGGLGKQLLDIEKPKDQSNIVYDAALLSALGGGVGAARGAGNGVLNATYTGLKGAAKGGLLGAGIGYLKDKDEREND